MLQNPKSSAHALTNTDAPAGVGGREAEGGGTRDAELEESEGIARPTSNAGSNAGVVVGQLRARMPQTGGRKATVARAHVRASYVAPTRKWPR